MFGTFLPYWLDRAPDPRHGGVIERVGLDGGPIDVPQRRTMVQARALYAFSHAACIGAGARASAMAERIFAALVRHHWDRTADGWWHSVTVDGQPLDRRKDAYAQAFTVFAAAWYHRATGDDGARVWAERTVAFLDARMAAPADRGAWGGYVEQLSAAGGPAIAPPRRQNPHMHLLEALLAWYETTGDAAWLERAHAVVGLFRRRFFDSRTGSIAELFTVDWSPAPGADGRLREPGHHFEWAWLLGQYHRLTGDAGALQEAAALYRFGQAHGILRPVDAASVVIDQVDCDGEVVDGGRRLWPQAEALKAAVARWEFEKDATALQEAKARLAAMFVTHVQPDGPLWREQLDADGGDASQFLPLSSLYHLHLAFAEAMRVMEGP